MIRDENDTISDSVFVRQAYQHQTCLTRNDQNVSFIDPIHCFDEIWADTFVDNCTYVFVYVIVHSIKYFLKNTSHQTNEPLTVHTHLNPSRKKVWFVKRKNK